MTGADFSSSELLLIIFLDILVIALITWPVNKLLNKLLNFVSNRGILLLLWDLLLFSTKPYLTLLGRRQEKIDQTRREKNRPLYLLVTRPHMLIGFLSLIYVLLCIFLSADPAERFLEMSESTIAGSFMEMVAFIANPWDEQFSLTFILPPAIANFLAVSLFVPHYSAAKDQETLGKGLHWLLSTLEIPLFFATSLLFADFLTQDRFNLFMGLFEIPIGRLPIPQLLVPCLIVCFFLLLHPMLKSLLCWCKDMLQAFAATGAIFLLAFFIRELQVDDMLNGRIAMILLVFAAQQLLNLLSNIFILKLKSKDDRIVPRRLILEKYRKLGNQVTPPEYYNLDSLGLHAPSNLP